MAGLGQCGRVARKSRVMVRRWALGVLARQMGWGWEFFEARLGMVAAKSRRGPPAGS